MSKNQLDEGNSPSPKETKGNEKSLFVQVPLEVLEASISSSAMKLYLILLKYARQSNECWPSQQTLGRDMNLKPRRIADLLKELENAFLITIICRAKEGLSNLYRLLKVVPPKGSFGSSLPKIADGVSKKDIPGKQRKTGEGMQDSADESHAVEKHAIRIHTHKQDTPENEIPNTTRVILDSPVQDVCDFKVSGKEALARSVKPRKDDAGSLHIPLSASTKERVEAVLREHGVSEVRAKQLATTVIKEGLDEAYVRDLAEWIESQATSRTIYNPAGLLVQMVCQLTPVPRPKGAGVPTLNGLQLDLEQKKKFVEEQLPQIIAIEERNLLEARFERDKERIQARLNMLLAQQGKERRNLANGTAYLAERGIEFSPEYLTGQTSLQQHSDTNIKGGYLNAPTF